MKNVSYLIAGVLSCCAGVVAAAPLGTAFTYQGRLLKNGSPVNLECTLAFCLWDAPSGGNPVGICPVSFSDVPVEDGLFTVVLDFGPGAINGEARWLEIGVQCPGDPGPTTLEPRQELTPAPHALALPGFYTQQNATSPNIIGGFSGNLVTGGIGATISGGGESDNINQVTANFGTIGGGRGNTAGGFAATIAGGLGNSTPGLFACSGGANDNLPCNSPTDCIGVGATCELVSATTIGGGSGNMCDRSGVTIAGGVGNTATSAHHSSIGGGQGNSATGVYVTIAGGQDNEAGTRSTIGGGINNAADNGSTICGGQSNTATGGNSTVGGGVGNAASSRGSTVGGGEANTASGVYYSSVGGGFGNTASGSFSTVGGGLYNEARGVSSTIAGGGDSPLDPASGNKVYDHGGTISGGSRNRAGSDDGNAGSGSGATVAGGLSNAASGSGSTVGGGEGNTASGDSTTVSGGAGNQASSRYASIGGGSGNLATGAGTSIGGGQLNEATAPLATIAGGGSIEQYRCNAGPDVGSCCGRCFEDNSICCDDLGCSCYSGDNSLCSLPGACNWLATLPNRVSDTGGAIGGGSGNVAGDLDASPDNAGFATVSGGINNTAGALYTAVGGGEGNVASRAWSTIGGGSTNNATGDASSIGGGTLNNAQGAYATIAGGGPSDPDGDANGTNNRVYDDYGTIGGGGGNRVGSDDTDPLTATYATVGGGRSNSVRDSYSTIAGGVGNTVNGNRCTIAGGGNNSINTANRATIGGGVGNHANGGSSTVGGGEGNTAGANRSTVGGGEGNAANGESSTIPGGNANRAGGDYSLAAGRRAVVRDAAASGDADGDEGAFAWGDSTDADFVSTGPNQFLVGASGGIYLGANSTVDIPVGRFINTSTGGYLTTGGVWTDSSDRAAKENFEPLNGQAVLEQLADVPITRWSFKAQEASVRHIGPTAQDFHAAFGTGEDDKHIAALDTAGVALAAIQGLYEIVKQKDCRIAELEARLTALEAQGSQGKNERKGGE